MNIIIQLNSNVYCNSNAYEILFLNLKNGQYYVFNISGYNCRLCDNILIIKNELSLNLDILKLIDFLNDNYMGVLRDESVPFFSMDKFHLLYGKYKDFKLEKKYYYKDSLYNSLKVITFCINEVSSSYENLPLLSKQFEFLSNYQVEGNSLSLDNVKSVFHYLTNYACLKINLSGTNLLTNSENREIVIFLINACEVKLFIHIVDFIFQIDSIISHLNLTYIIIIDSATFFLINENLLKSLEGVKFAFHFLFTRIDELQELSNMDLDCVKLYPVYAGDYDSLNNVLLYSLDDVLHAKSLENKIFRNYFINEYLFGKLVIHNDGKVYSNIQSNSIGNIFNTSFDDILYYASYDLKSWLYTRSLFPLCKECLFNCICQPLSYYELLLNKTFCDKCH